MKFLDFFSIVVGNFCPLGSGSGYGSTDLIESGSNADPDPKHWFYYFNFRYRIDWNTFNFSANQLWRRSRQQSRGTRTGRGNSRVTNQRHYGELARRSTGPRTALRAVCRRSTGYSDPLRGMRLTRQRCGTVTIFYGSGSGSDFWKFMVPVPVPTFEKCCFRFRFLLLKSYGSGSGSGSKNVGKIFAFLLSELFYKEKVYKFQQFIVKCEWKEC
jgi:hypothetical protein